MQPQSTGWERSALDYEVQKRRADMVDAQQGGGWRDWAMFASLLMYLTGAFAVASGLISVFNDSFMAPVKGQILVLDLTAWGWAQVVIGVLVLLAANAVRTGRMWGRIVGIAFASLNAFAQFALIPVTPVWSVIAVTLDVVIIISLSLHGGEIA